MKNCQLVNWFRAQNRHCAVCTAWLPLEIAQQRNHPAVKFAQFT